MKEQNKSQIEEYEADMVVVKTRRFGQCKDQAQCLRTWSSAWQFKVPACEKKNKAVGSCLCEKFDCARIYVDLVDDDGKPLL